MCGGRKTVAPYRTLALIDIIDYLGRYSSIMNCMDKINLKSEIQFIKGVGPKMAAKFNKLGVETVKDLLYFYPRVYKDYTNITKIGDIEISNTEYQTWIPGQARDDNSVTISGNIVGINNKTTSRKRFTVTEAVVEDGSGSLKVVWFNQPFLQKMLKAGSKVILNGKISRDPYSNTLQMESPDRANRPMIVPVYSETAGISSKYISKIYLSIENKVESIQEYLPKDVVEGNGLMVIQDAIKQLHQPKDSKTLETARRRMAFDELFFIALKAQISREEIRSEKAPALKIDEKQLKKFTEKLPYTLTNDQKRASWQIIKDIGNNEPMNRLLNGDVGSGKTVVAAFASYVTVQAGNRAIIMAPTEILANQHYGSLCEIFRPFNITVGLLTSSGSKYQKTNIKKQISSKIQTPKNTSDEIFHSIQDDTPKKLTANNLKLEASEADVLIGTHAILHMKKQPENVGLVVVDEQHRFGVKQRAKIKSFRSEGLRPHFLSMTATPIPRTMQLALFGDLDVSVIKEMPKGRKKIETEYVDESHRTLKYKFIENQIKEGRQAFVVCPLIEETEESTKQELFDLDRKSVIAEYKKLNEQIFPKLTIGMLHGRLKVKEKDRVMAQFTSSKLDIVVSTSVVEVGVDIKNASVMMIEDAERFGLAQLHQFRGRVGRGEHQSYCLLFSSSKSPKSVERLRTLERVSDGFELAKEDLKTRGPGEIYGTMQSGEIDIRFANLSDSILISRATKSAKELIEYDPKLSKHGKILSKLGDFLESKHLE